MKQILRILLIAAGFLLMMNAVCSALIASVHVGVIAAFLIGLLGLLCGVYWEQVGKATKTGLLKWLKYLVVASVLFVCGLSAFLAVYGNMDSSSWNEDAVIVLGAGIRGETVTKPLRNRLDAAVAYAKKNENAVIVVSGGQGFGEIITEALAMERYLVRAGVDKDRIIKEEKATSTYENIAYSKKILDDYFDTPYRCAMITNGFHIYRAVAMAKNAGMEVSHYHAALEWYTVPVNYLRECAAVLTLWIMG